jgi:hypothetical protein
MILNCNPLFYMAYDLKIKEICLLALQQPENRCKMPDDFDRNARLSYLLA